jgi:hypothetical protein
MAVMSALAHSVGTLGRRDFWTFKVVHAVLGAVLTIAGASGGIFITDHIRKDILRVDGAIAENTHRTESIERAVSQFQLLQTEGVLLGALSTGDAIRPEMRKQFQNLGFLIRKGSSTRMIDELNADNLPGLMRERAEQNRLVDAAVAAKELSAWDELLKFEMGLEQRVRALQDKVQTGRARLLEQRRDLESRLAVTTNWTFILQQLGFFIVLLAGLIHQHDHPTLNAANAAQLASSDGTAQ